MSAVGFVKISVVVTFSASRNALLGFREDDVLRVAVSAPPVDGRANRELIRYLAELGGCTQSSIRILHGFTSRQKLVELPVSAKEKIIANI